MTGAAVFPIAMAEPTTLDTQESKKPEAPEEQLKIPSSLPVLPLRDIVIFPFMIIPLFVQRDKSIRAVDQALSENRMILLVTQKDVEQDEPTAADMYQVGTVAIIMRMLKLPDGRIRILVQGLARARIKYMDESRGYLNAEIEVLQEAPPTNTLEVEALIRNVRASMEKAVGLGKSISPEVMAIAINLDDPGRLCDLAASNLELKVEDAQSVLETVSPLDRLRRINELLAKELEVLTVQQEIDTQAKGEIDRSQREFYLRQQLKAIQSELGEGNELAEEIAVYREKLAEAKMPKEAESEVERQLKRLERMHPDAAEAGTLRSYLDIILNLPWSKSTKENLDLEKARKVLDEDHYGLDKIKERIIEALAVRKINPKSRGQILCLVGPPGVGKTSLGRSIARATNRKFQRLSLGGLHDEAEIRGHRRTYIGAMPGRIVQSIQQAGTNNPLIMLDEIDKVGADFRGDPSSALLEVLDPEQNFSFRDNYLNVPFDLSNVMFMTTANMLDTVQPALRDRMETIVLSGYTEEEKLQIAKRHIIPKQLEAHGLSPKNLVIRDPGLRMIVTQYTRESGLRQLEREIAAVCRKVARKVAEGNTSVVNVSVKNIHNFLGAPKVQLEEILRRDQVGVATGLAWTSTGGDILFIECLLMPGKGALQLTGQLGDVMKESAQAALSYARARSKELGIEETLLSSKDVHIHIPEGATPKDGPSAGITLLTAVVSALTDQPVRKSIAMTGEITLRGNVLPIGGLKEKLLAARRAHIKTVLVPALNKRDVEEIKKDLPGDLKLIYVEDVRDVLKLALIQKSSAPKNPAPKQPVTPPRRTHPEPAPAHVSPERF